MDMAEECPNVRVPRVTALEVDPGNSSVVWAGVEVDGVRRSLDGGDTWERINGGLNDPDIHGMTVSTGGTTTVFTSTPGEVFASTDTGESWQGLGVRDSFPMRYCRGITVKQDDPDTLLVATGDSPFGTTGAIQRSTDRGNSWERLALPQEPNTPDVGLCHPCVRPRLHPMQQPLRTDIRYRRRRGLVGQAAPGVQRGARHGLDAELAPTKTRSNEE